MIVVKAIVEKVELIPRNPERFPMDRFKIDNAGNFRAFETHSYRVAYKHSDTEVRILRVRHVHQEPLEY